MTGRPVRASTAAPIDGAAEGHAGARATEPAGALPYDPVEWERKLEAARDRRAAVLAARLGEASRQHAGAASPGAADPANRPVAGRAWPSDRSATAPGMRGTPHATRSTPGNTGTIDTPRPTGAVAPVAPQGSRPQRWRMAGVFAAGLCVGGMIGFGAPQLTRPLPDAPVTGPALATAPDTAAVPALGLDTATVSATAPDSVVVPAIGPETAAVSATAPDSVVVPAIAAETGAFPADTVAVAAAEPTAPVPVTGPPGAVLAMGRAEEPGRADAPPEQPAQGAPVARSNHMRAAQPGASRVSPGLPAPTPLAGTGAAEPPAALAERPPAVPAAVPAGNGEAADIARDATLRPDAVLPEGAPAQQVSAPETGPQPRPRVNPAQTAEDTGRVPDDIAEPDISPVAAAEVAPPGFPDLDVILLVPQGAPATAQVAARAALSAAALDAWFESRTVHGISATHLRYYHAADLPAAQVLADRLGIAVRDFTSFRPLPDAGHVEVWLAGAGAAAPSQAAAARPGFGDTLFGATREVSGAIRDALRGFPANER